MKETLERLWQQYGEEHFIEILSEFLAEMQTEAVEGTSCWTLLHVPIEFDPDNAIAHMQVLSRLIPNVTYTIVFDAPLAQKPRRKSRNSANSNCFCSTLTRTDELQGLRSHS